MEHWVISLIAHLTSIEFDSPDCVHVLLLKVATGQLAVQVLIRAFI